MASKVLPEFRGSAERAMRSGSRGGGTEVFVLLTLCGGGMLLDKVQRAAHAAGGGDDFTEAEVWKYTQDVAEALLALDVEVVQTPLSIFH